MRQRRSGGTRRLHAAVTDGASRAALVCTRSLGRHGLTVGVLCDPEPAAPATYSRHATVTAVMPPPGATAQSRLDALLAFLACHEPHVLIPTHDATVELLRQHRERVEAMTAVALPAPEPLAISVDKQRTAAAAKAAGVAVPTGLDVADHRALPAAIRTIGTPAVLRPPQSWLPEAPWRGRQRCQEVIDGNEFSAAGSALLEACGSFTAQPWLTGPRESISVVRVDGKLRGLFAQSVGRTYPALGGTSIVRRSIVPPPDITAATDRLLAEIEYDGYAEVEFRRGADGQAYLMEINPRLSAAVELAQRCGVDYPLMLLSWKGEAPWPAENGYAEGRVMRWLGGDLRWLAQSLRQQGRPDVPHRSAALATFVGDFARPARYDYLTANDPMPALAAMVGFASAVSRHAKERA